MKASGAPADITLAVLQGVPCVAGTAAPLLLAVEAAVVWPFPGLGVGLLHRAVDSENKVLHAAGGSLQG